MPMHRNLCIDIYMKVELTYLGSVLPFSTVSYYIHIQCRGLDRGRGRYLLLGSRGPSTVTLIAL